MKVTNANFGSYQVNIGDSVSRRMNDIDFVQGNHYAYPNTAKAVRYLTNEQTASKINRKLGEGHQLNVIITGANGFDSSNIDMILKKPNGELIKTTWYEHLGTSGDQIFESMGELKAKLKHMIKLSNPVEAGVTEKVLNLLKKVL